MLHARLELRELLRANLLEFIHRSLTTRPPKKNVSSSRSSAALPSELGVIYLDARGLARSPRGLDHLDLPLDQRELPLADRPRVQRNEEDGVAEGDVLVQVVNEGKDARKVVVGDEILEPIEEDHGTLARIHEVLDGDRDVLRRRWPHTVLLVRHAAEPEDRGPLEAIVLGNRLQIGRAH